MNFNNFEEFESKLDNLYANEQYDIADRIMENQIDNICKLSPWKKLISIYGFMLLSPEIANLSVDFSNYVDN